MTEIYGTPQVAASEFGAQDFLVTTPQAAAQVRSRQRWLAQVNSPLRVIGYYFALVYTFVIFTQLHQLLIMAVGADTHLLIIVGVPMIVLVLCSGGVRRTLRWPAAQYWVGFSLAMLVAVAFSSWRGESLAITFRWLRVEVLILFVIAGCVLTWSEVRNLMTVLAVAAVVDVLAGRAIAGQVAGRFELTGTTMSDPNDFAAHLIWVLPFLLLVAISSWRSIFTRTAAAGVLLYGVFLILLTGSRGALGAIAITVLFCIWKLRPGQKVLAASIVIILACLTPIIVPQKILTRFSATFRSTDSADPDPDVARAVESREGRTYLLKQSLLATLSHPLFGVGAGQFQNYEGRRARESGLHGSWHETHNSLTQVSSELGIPALLFFLAAIIATYRMLDEVYREAGKRPRTQENQQIRATAFCLLISLVGFCVASLFLTLAYRFYLPALSAQAIVLYRAVQRKWIPAVDEPERV
jgi:putative inorganic carbon (hco3(-)) transporter